MKYFPVGPSGEFAEKFDSFCWALEREIEDRIGLLMDGQKLTHDEFAAALRLLYWRYPAGLSEDWLKIGFISQQLFNVNEYSSIIQNCRCQFPCDECGSLVPVLVRDREDADRFWGEIALFCPECTKKRDEAKAERYKEEERMAREAKIAELRAMPYADYLQTEHWQAVRKATLERDEHRCQLCRSTERLQVHHNTYERRGCEDPDDTITLCGDCHQTFHDHRQLARPQ
jgi:hypothetical protein